MSEREAAVLIIEGQITDECGKPVYSPVLGPDYLNVNAMMRLLDRGAYAVRAVDEKARTVQLAYPVDDAGADRTGPVYEFDVHLNWWARRGMAVVC